MAGIPLPPGYSISDDPALLDIDVVHAFIANESYWARGIPKSIVERTIANSLCWGVYCAGKQIGFARVISDKATFAYLCDVFIAAEHRGRGLSKALVATILAHPDLQNLRRWMLVTADAQKLYEQFGFQIAPNPDRYMEIHRPGIYRQKDS